MTLGLAVLLLAVVLAGIVLVFRYLSLVSLVLVGYIGLTALFLDAARNQPPA